MIGWGQVQEAWGLFRARWLLWLGIGLVAGVPLAGVLSLSFALGTRTADGLRLPFWVQAIGYGSTVLLFVIAGGMVAAGLHQARTGNLVLKRLFVPRSAVLPLILLGVGSLTSQYAFEWLIRVATRSNYSREICSVFSLLAAPPFVFAIPLAVDRGLGVVRAVQGSVRIALPRYFRILLVQLSLFFLLGLVMAPFMCIAVLPSMGTDAFNPAPFVVVFTASFAIGEPLYYLVVCCIYRRLVPDEEGRPEG